jgi:DNA polymerase III delta subunit
MITLCDHSMSRLRQESDKLVCRAKFEERTQVPAEWVDELVMPSAEAALGQLADAVTGMSCREAASIFENLAGQNYDVSEIFGTISRALTTLQVFHSALSDGRSPKDACTASGAFPWLADKMASTARSRTASGLRRSVEACYECDTSLKLDSKNKLFTLQRLIFLLTSEAYR